MSYTIIIPARYASTRLPGKTLADIAGKPMIVRVLEQTKKASAARVIVATDNQRVFDVVKSFDGEVVLTSEQHKSGTERLAEVIDLFQLPDDEVIVNVQGDEPLIPPIIIEQVANNLVKYQTGMATLALPISDAKDLFNPNVVKVITDKNGYALYFSRAPIPWDRDRFSVSKDQIGNLYSRHIGIYAYRAGFIRRYINYSESPLEQIEMLEQLRVLWHGEKIHVEIAKEAPATGVDTLEDLEEVRAVYLQR